MIKLRTCSGTIFRRNTVIFKKCPTNYILYHHYMRYLGMCWSKVTQQPGATHIPFAGIYAMSLLTSLKPLFVPPLPVQELGVFPERLIAVYLV